MNTIHIFKNNYKYLWNKNKDSNSPKNWIDTHLLKVKSQNNNFLKEKYFGITNSKLFLIKNSNCIGFIDLNYIGIDYDKSSLKIEFFTQNKNFFLFFNNKNIFKSWKKIVMNNCIRNNLLNKFEIIFKIHENDKYKFYLSKKLNKQNNKKYIIKVISKKDLKNKEDYLNLINEIKKTRKCFFNNFLKFYHIYESLGSFYLVFECNIINNIEKNNKYNILEPSVKFNTYNIILKGIINFLNLILGSNKLFLYFIQKKKLEPNIFEIISYSSKDFVLHKFFISNWIIPKMNINIHKKRYLNFWIYLKDKFSEKKFSKRKKELII